MLDITNFVKKLRKLHLFLGCISTPLLILFAATGAVQMFGVKIPILYEVHTKGYGSLPFKLLAFFMGLAVVVTSILGLIMAFQLSNDRRTVWTALIFGTALPILLLFIVHFKR